MPPPIHRLHLPLDPAKRFDEIVDVRSPGEFAEDHLTGARNLPVLDDEERARVGTIYKRVSPFEARKIGAALVSRNIARHLESHFASKPAEYRPLLYCWRGGQRSGSLATVLNDTGWAVGVLEGGYRAYRRHVRETTAWQADRLRFVVVNGFTGSGKTLVLKSLRSMGAQTLDLEGLARHKGSVFGGNPGHPQPTQKRFESLLFDQLERFEPERPVFLEAESSKVGRLHLPHPLWDAMKRAPVLEIDCPLEARADYLCGDYAGWLDQPERVLATLERLRGLVPHESLDRWKTLADHHSWRELVAELLAGHYDPRYQVGGEGSFRAPAARIPLHAHDDASVSSCARAMLEHAAAAVAGSD